MMGHFYIHASSHQKQHTYQLDTCILGLDFLTAVGAMLNLRKETLGLETGHVMLFAVASGRALGLPGSVAFTLQVQEDLNTQRQSRLTLIPEGHGRCNG
ncbi:hypothetical protein SRHO_G00149070 [Serrasalmus rhombeus]